LQLTSFVKKNTKEERVYSLNEEVSIYHTQNPIPFLISYSNYKNKKTSPKHTQKSCVHPEMKNK
jgi:hypothetical protein